MHVVFTLLHSSGWDFGDALDQHIALAVMMQSVIFIVLFFIKEFGDSFGGGAGEVVVAANNERFKSEFRIEHTVIALLFQSMHLLSTAVQRN